MRLAYNTDIRRLAPLQTLISEIQRPVLQMATDGPTISDICADDDSLSDLQAKVEFYGSPATKISEDVRSSYKYHTKLFYRCQAPFSMPTKKEIDGRISNWLKNKTAAENWTARDMAQELGISPQHLDALYQGRRGYGKKTIGRIEKRFKTTYTAIAGLDKERHEMRDIEALLEEWKGLALHYKKLYEDLQKRVEIDPLSIGPPIQRGGR